MYDKLEALIKQTKLKPESYIDFEDPDLPLHFQQLIQFIAAVILLKDDIENYQEPIKEFLLTNDDTLVDYYYQQMKGAYCILSKNYDFAIMYYNKSSELAHKLEDYNKILDSYHFSSLPYYYKSEYDVALTYILKALDYIDKATSIKSTCDVYLTYASILSTQNELEHVELIYNKINDLFEKLENKEEFSNYFVLLVNMAELSYLQGNGDLAEKQMDYAMKIGKENDTINFRLLDDIYKNIAQYYKEHKNYEKALIALETYTNSTFGYLMMQFNSVEKDKKIDDILEIETLRKSNKMLHKKIDELSQDIGEETDIVQNTQLLLEIANANNNDKILAFFQPKYSLKENKYVGAEALIRWEKEGKIIFPGDFIEEVEDQPIIIELTKTIIRQSLQFVSDLKKLGIENFLVSVNVTPYSLINHSLSVFIENELLLNNLPPECLEVELTERTFLENNPLILKEILRLKKIGIKISLDDFGTGYSSLSCINELSIDVVKIDRSLITDMEKDIRVRKLVKGIITLMHDLDLKIVAEGVENIDQVNILRDLKCDQIQGYYYSKPKLKSQLLTDDIDKFS